MVQQDQIVRECENKMSAMILTKKYKIEPVEPLKVGEVNDWVYEVSEVLGNIMRLKTLLETTHRKPNCQDICLSLGVQKSLRQKLQFQSENKPVTSQNGSVTKIHLCNSSLVSTCSTRRNTDPAVISSR